MVHTPAEPAASPRRVGDFRVPFSATALSHLRCRPSQVAVPLVAVTAPAVNSRDGADRRRSAGQCRGERAEHPLPVLR